MVVDGMAHNSMYRSMQAISLPIGVRFTSTMGTVACTLTSSRHTGLAICTPGIRLLHESACDRRTISAVNTLAAASQIL